MATTGAAQLLRSADAPKRATLLELLFDVVYVASFALVSTRLASDITWSGVAKTLVLLMAVWWTWTVTATTTDFYNPRRLPIQAVVATTMLGAILMAVAIPSGFSAHAPIFASAYVGIHLVRGILLVTALRGHEAQVRAARFLFWFTVSGIAWLAGAFAGASTRGLLWAVAIAIDFVAGGFRYPTPWRGRVPLSQYEKVSEHIGERYQQVMILALGDLILVPTLRIGGSEFNLARVVAFLVAFATTLLLWQLYLYSAGAILLVGVRHRFGRGARVSPYTHFVMVAGIVATAAGSELVIARPTGPTPVGWVCVVIGGAVLFVAGRTTFEYLAFARLSRSRVAWLVVLVVLGPALVFVPPVFVTLTVGVILVGVTITDRLRASEQLPRWIGRLLPERDRGTARR